VTNVVELKVVEIGEGFRFEAEKILEAAKAKKFDRMMIIGELENGEMYVAGTANAGETLVLMELAKRVIVP
jgi:hypothetical protein